MYDPTRPLNGQSINQVPATPTGNISKEDFDAQDNARLQRKFGMSQPQEEVRPTENYNFNNTPTPQYEKPNPYSGLSDQDRQAIVNSYLPKVETPTVEPQAIENTPSINMQNNQTDNEEDMFGDIFGSTAPSVTPLPTEVTPEVGTPQTTQPSDVNDVFTRGIVEASLSAQVNPNEVFEEINNLSHADLVSIVTERIRNRGVAPQQANPQVSPQTPSSNEKQLSYLDKLAQTPIILGGGEEQVPVVSSNNNGYRDYDEY